METKNETKTVFKAASFKKALAAVMPAASRVSPLPILTHIRVRFAALQATDLDVQITAPLDATGDPVDICVPLDKLRAAADVAGDKIAFTVLGLYCTIKAGKSRFKVPIIDGREFPTIAEAAPEATIQTTPEMHAAIGRVAFAASIKDVRYYLNGVYLDCKDDEFTAIASNSIIMAAAKTALPVQPFTVLIHRDNIDILAKSAPGIWHISSGMVVAENEDARIVMKAIEQRFPDWRRVMGNAVPTHSITLPRAELIEAVALSKTMSKTRPIRIASGDALQVKAIGQGAEEVETEVKIVKKTGSQSINTGLNGGQLEPILKAINASEITITWTDTDNVNMPLMVQDGDFRAVIVPLRI